MAKTREQPFEEVWKERLAFTSGSILIWGLLLLKLQPFIANFQTGRHLHFWESQWWYHGGFTPDYLMYTLLLSILTLGIWTVLLAAIHILCRGVWLIIPSEDIQSSQIETLKKNLNTIAKETYFSVFALSLFIACSIFVGGPIIVFSVILIQPLLAKYLGLSTGTAGFLASIAISFMLGVLISFIRHRKKPKGTMVEMSNFLLNQLRSRRARLLSIALILLFFISYLMVLEITYTVELNVNKRVLYQSQDKSVEFHVKLGGATSSPQYASLKVVGIDSMTIKEMSLRDIGSGQYFAHVPLNELQPGVYQISLKYPHVSINFSYPFLHSITERAEQFLVVP